MNNRRTFLITFTLYSVTWMLLAFVGYINKSNDLIVVKVDHQRWWIYLMQRNITPYRWTPFTEATKAFLPCPINWGSPNNWKETDDHNRFEKWSSNLRFLHYLFIIVFFSFSCYSKRTCLLNSVSFFSNQVSSKCRNCTCCFSWPLHLNAVSELFARIRHHTPVNLCVILGVHTAVNVYHSTRFAILFYLYISLNSRNINKNVFFFRFAQVIPEQLVPGDKANK